MTGIHDLGGSPGAGPIDKSQHETEDWERLADAVTVALDKKGIRQPTSTGGHREPRPGAVQKLGYYERWIAATELLLVEKGILTREEIDQKAAELEERWG